MSFSTLAAFTFASVFLFFGTSTLFAQNSCKYCGKYDGKMDTITNGDTTRINVTLTLSKDSVYSYDIQGVFSWCTSRTFKGTGKWLADNDWIYFNPDPDENGIVVFIMEYPVPSGGGDLSKEELDQMYKHYNNGYTLKITKDNAIFFRIAWDCFKGKWRNNPVKKIN